RIDTLGAAPCGDDCTRDFPLSRDIVEAGASIGILPHATLPTLLRLRLYRAGVIEGSDPRPDSTIDVIVSLPPVGEEGITEAHVVLSTDSSGQPHDSPIAASLGPAPEGLVGSWPGARRQRCAGTAGANEVCIPGGAFWMGNPHAVSNSPSFEMREQRLVSLSPFYIDKTEVTVGEMRSWLATLDPATAAPMTPLPWSGSLLGSNDRDWCSYSDDPGRQALPVNCVDWNAAQSYCLAQAKDLPTEAQLEYLAGGLESRLYAWGSDEPRCEDAVFGNIGGVIGDNLVSPCAVPGSIGGPLPALRERYDRDRVVSFDHQEVLDVAGNVAERARDAFDVQVGPCWPSGVLRDPVCIASDPNADRTVKEGAWLSPPALLRAAHRFGGGPDARVSAIGFRCARPGI
ncbi:MAG TPA: SUMF1/EgtB/PvdO family nonheme iron enzyme, partial [Polyangiaceae bacterium]|nr:SUMF1/EgtB/PvdO family nonheme iron enzyme [Polyangiaceae bacterium]